MKLQLSCIKCLQEDLVNVPINTSITTNYNAFDYKYVEINDEGLYEMECQKGHKTFIAVQNEKFEVLFDMALSAMLDGYKQEAVACAHASMERFHEWCIKIFTIHNKVSFEYFDKTWKYIAITERQLGAFYFLYLNTFKTVPDRFCEDMVRFRNNVLHNGTIPSSDELYKYLDYVYNYIRMILKQIKSQFDDEIQEIVSFKLRKLYTRLETGTMCLPCVLGLFTAEEAVSESLETAITSLKWRNFK